mmetsp:Transcript_3353/g.7153  ORF Transcript_3353/g.7153 Transcript_3353/m.7153 type:complete len:227 (-) Transcript_3353:148-828(-)
MALQPPRRSKARCREVPKPTPATRRSWKSWWEKTVSPRAPSVDAASSPTVSPSTSPPAAAPSPRRTSRSACSTLALADGWRQRARSLLRPARACICKSRRGLRRISPPNQLPACLLASSNPNPPPPPLPPSRSSFQTGATSAPNALAALTSRALTSTSACARRPSPRPPRRQPQQAQRPPRTPLHPLPNKDPLANKLSTPCWLRPRPWPPPRSGRSVATISPRLRL